MLLSPLLIIFKINILQKFFLEYCHSVKYYGRSFGRPGQEVIKLFPCSSQLIRKFILLINVKIPTIVGILTYISMINTTSERLKARNFFICRYISFYEQLKFCAGVELGMKKVFITLGPDLDTNCLKRLLAYDTNRQRAKQYSSSC